MLLASVYLCGGFGGCFPPSPTKRHSNERAWRRFVKVSGRVSTLCGDQSLHGNIATLTFNIVTFYQKKSHNVSNVYPGHFWPFVTRRCAALSVCLPPILPEGPHNFQMLNPTAISSSRLSHCKIDGSLPAPVMMHLKAAPLLVLLLSRYNVSRQHPKLHSSKKATLQTKCNCVICNVQLQ